MRGVPTRSTVDDGHPNFEIAVSMRWSGCTFRDQSQEPAHGNSSSVVEALSNYLDYRLRRISQGSPMIVLMGIAFIYTDAIDSIEPFKAVALQSMAAFNHWFSDESIAMLCFLPVSFFDVAIYLVPIISPISPLLCKGILH